MNLGGETECINKVIYLSISPHPHHQLSLYGHGYWYLQWMLVMATVLEIPYYHLLANIFIFYLFTPFIVPILANII